MSEDNPLIGKERLFQPEPISDRERYILGVAYMLGMGVCGLILVAIGSTLSDLAENCGTTSTAVGTVFIARGIGAILGAVFSAKLYMWFYGNHVMTVALALITVLLIVLPFNTSVVALHIYFLFMGLCTAVTDTGCQILTRKIHGKTAGPWLGANTVAFGISGALVPLVELLTSNLVAQFAYIAGFVALVTVMVFFGPNPEKDGKLLPGKPGGPGGAARKPPHYYVEMVISVMVFCFVGGKVTATAYLQTYVEETGVIPDSQETALILVMWLAITIGRLAGVQDQRFVTNATLPKHLTFFVVGGVLAMLLIVWFPSSADSLWIGIAFYGLFNGPCVGYCYDWNNRITFPTEKSMSIVMFGLNFGASLVPYITSYIWSHGGGPRTLIVTTLLSMLIPLPLLFTTRFLSYDPSINPTLKHAYQGLPQDDTPI